MNFTENKIKLKFILTTQYYALKQIQTRNNTTQIYKNKTQNSQKKKKIN